MKMINLEARSAIKKTAIVNSNKDYSVEEVSSGFIYQIGLWDDSYELVEKQCKLAFNASFPKMGEISEVGHDGQLLKIYSLQPNKYVIQSEIDISQQLLSICDNVQATMINQSSAFSVIKLSGKGAHTLMQKLCFFDFTSSDVAVINTQVASAYNVMIEVMDDGYQIFVTRTMARSLWDYLAKLD